jgi:hypothetical protein
MGALMALCGFDLAFAIPTWLLIPGALTGMLGVAGDQGPFLTVDQAVLAETAKLIRRNRAFARY